MVKISNYLKQKGQGIVEYALLLAFVVGIAVALQGVGLKDAVVGVFDDVAKNLADFNKEKSHLYTDGLAKWSKMTMEDIAKENNDDRLAADAEGLSNLASLFVGKTKDEIAEIFPTSNFANLQKDGGAETVLVSKNETKSDTTTKLEYRNNTQYDRGTAWLQGTGSDLAFNSTYRWTYGDRYFFSDEMGGTAENSIKLSFTYGDDGTVSSARAWAQSGNNIVSDKLDVTVTK